jgi:LuxR family maltose regulon positive regulatory protein
MPEALIASKFFIPVCTSQNVDRLQLLRKLRLGLDRKLMLISAPPGFGKTTLLAEWVSKLNVPVAWLSLDQEDNSPYRFMTYLIAAIQHAIPNFGQVALSAANALPQPPLETLATHLVNEIAFHKFPLMIILDDFQHIQDPTIHSVVMSSLDRLPPNVHVCISTRSDPPWMFGRLRAQGDLLEIRTKDLRFDQEEAALFLERSTGFRLSRTDVYALANRTEGWVVALKMAANSLKNSSSVHSFIRSFTGSNRAIVDYLIEEVLNRQTPDCREFLVKTSIFDQINSGLCNAVLGRSESGSMLEMLEKSNLFLQPIDETHNWFRYHQLFRELLQNQLGQYSREEIRQLHRNASAWFLMNENPLASLKHALKAQDLGIAANIAEQHALEFLDRGQISEVADWLAALPMELLTNWPWLLITQAWVDFYMGRVKEVAFTLEKTISKLDRIKNPVAQKRLLGHLHTIRAQLECTTPNPKLVQAEATKALDFLPESDYMGRSQAYSALGHYYRLEDDIQHAIKAFEQAILDATLSRNEHLRVSAIGNLAIELIWSGWDNEKAESICRQVLDEYASPDQRRSLPAVVYPMTAMSNILLFQCELERANELCKEAVDLSRFWQNADALHYALTVQTDIFFALKDLEGAMLAIREAKVIDQRGASKFSQSTFFFEMQYDLETDHIDLVRRWVETQKFDFSDINLRTNHYLIYSLFLLKMDRFEEEVRFSQRFFDYFQEINLVYGMANMLADQACAFAGMGELEKAFKNLGRIGSLGDVHRVALILSRRGPVMIDLLKLALARGIDPKKLREILDIIHDKISKGSSTSSSRGETYLTVCLTSREVEILKLLDSGKSSTELARDLVVAVSTVRTHMKSIYSKLGVSHRIEAVRKARELKLI